METYGVDSDEVWEVHGSTWVVKHKALERIAAEKGVVWERPAMIETNSKDGIVAICVFGKLGDKLEWSIGEASPKNCKNAYYYAMAEKRAKDRVILKLLTAHGALYSEAEADEFQQPQQPQQRQNPHVTRPADIMPATEYDESGQPIDNIPLADPSIKPLPKKNAKAIFQDLQTEIWAIGDAQNLLEWGARNANRVGALPDDWREILRGVYREHLDAIRNQEVADEQRMAS
jgi:hypothetical protein